ncbi:hypothetical protein E2562_022992 [Oryza meyeriana var. granulata]|uniref:Uncharacterized protein n=1 Tax=Oryza meyeriana var. granulata TaxID=110450 RepID=A0A6G1EYC9_9ORYZ|nr:hypothetical protein E2562_022992 [Oryza meyeriana var. granulata]
MSTSDGKSEETGKQLVAILEQLKGINSTLGEHAAAICRVVSCKGIMGLPPSRQQETPVDGRVPRYHKWDFPTFDGKGNPTI